MKELVVLLLFVLVASCAPPQVISARKYVKEISFFGDRFKVGFMEVDFDQDLHVIKTLSGPCGYSSCVVPTCPPCNYSDPRVCSYGAEDDVCPCGGDFCPENSPKWSRFLEYGQMFLANRTVLTGPDLFSFRVPPAPAVDCDIPIIRAQEVHAGGNIELSDELWLATFTWATAGGTQYLTLCPDVYQGTIRIGFWAIAAPVVNPRTLQSRLLPFPKKMPTTAVDSTCLLPAPLNETHYCFALNNIYYIPRPSGVERWRFAIPIQRGKCYLLSGTTTSVALWLSSENPGVSGLEDDNIDFWHVPRSGANPREYTDEQDQGFVVKYCTSELSDYIYGVAIVTPGAFPVRFTFFDNKDWLELLAFDEIPQTSFHIDMMHTTTVKAGGKTFRNSNWNDIDLTRFDSGVMNFRGVFPSENPNPLYLFPEWLKEDHRYSYARPDHWDELVPRRYTAALLLEHDFSYVSNQFARTSIWPKRYTFLTEEEFNSVELTFNGNIANSNWEAVDITITDWEEADVTCDIQLFFNVSSQIEEYLSDVLSSSVSAKLLFNSYSLDLLANSKAYTDCRDYAYSLFTTVSADPNLNKKPYLTTDCVYESGTPEYLRDECCNVDLSFYRQCLPSERPYTPDEFDSVIPDIELECSDPDCMKVSLARLWEDKQRAEAPDGCRAKVPGQALFVSTRITEMLKCRRKNFNVIGDRGLDCDHDLDCPDGAICASDGCVLPIDRQLYNFVDCTLSALNGFTRLKIKEILGLTGELTVDTVLANVVREGNCRDPYNYRLAAFDRYSYAYGCITVGLSDEQACPGYYALDPNDALNFLDCSTCGGLAFAKTPFEPQCERTYCNYDSLLGEDDCNTTSSFCGLCENGGDCIEVPGLNQTSCENAVWCKLANGTEFLAPSIDACTASYSCDKYCPGCDQNQCNQYHYCTDKTDRIWGPFFNYESGACAYKILYPPPWTQSVYQCVAPGRTDRLGWCVDNGIPSRNCTRDTFPYRNVYVIEDIRYYYAATSKKECEDYHGYQCKNVLYAGAQNSLDDDLSNDLTEEQCLLAGGTWEYAYLWKQARWLPGQPRQLEWRPRTFGPRWVPDDQMFDFALFTSVIGGAIDGLYGLGVQASIFCRFSKSNALLREIVCNCVEDKDIDDCYKSASKINVTDVGAFCGNDASTITAPPFSLTSTPETISEDGCVIVFMSTSSIFLFRDSSAAPRINNVIVNYKEDTLWAVRTEDTRAIIGYVLTDGLNVYIGDANVTNVTFVVEIHPQRRGEEERDDFPVLDLAIGEGSGDIHLRPLELDVIEDEYGFFYVNVPELTNGATYWIIQRREVWQDIDRDIFESGEIAYISVLLALYVIGLCFSIFKLARGAYITWVELHLPPFSRIVVVLLLMISFFIFRVVLFSMLLSKALFDTQAPAIDYVLVEFPILLYFCYISNYIIIWASVARLSKKVTNVQKNFVKTADRITIALNIFITCMFVVIIIVFEEVVGSPEAICNGTVVLWDDNAAFIIGLVYRCIFGSIDILFGFFLLITGLQFNKVLQGMLSVNKEKQMKVLVVTFVGSAGLVAQGIVWIIFPAIKQDISNYLSLSILLVVEIIPTLMFLSLLVEKSIKDDTSKSAISGYSKKSQASRVSKSSKKVSDSTA